MFLSINAYEELFKIVDAFLFNCDSFIMSYYDIIIEEMQKYLPDKLHEFDLNGFIESLKRKR